MPDIFTSPPKPNEQSVQSIPEEGNQPEVKLIKKALSSSLEVNPQGSPPGFFSAYREYPTGITFINQEPEEDLILFIRRHFITNVPWIFFTLLFLFVPPIITTLFTVANFNLFTLPPQLTMIIVAFYYLWVAYYALGKFIVWFYHVGIVTQKRLLDLDVDNILTYHLAETEIRDIVDVSYSQKGFFQSFFNFGNVPIQTEAIKANFEFEEAPHPSEVADIVTDLRPGGHHP